MVVLTGLHLCQFVFPLYCDRNKLIFFFLQSHKTRIVFVSDRVVFLLDVKYQSFTILNYFYIGAPGWLSR